MLLKRIFISFFAITVCVAEDRAKKTAQPDRSRKIFGYTVEMPSKKQCKEFAIGFGAGATQQTVERLMISCASEVGEEPFIENSISLGTLALMRKGLKSTGNESDYSRWGSVFGQIVGSVSLEEKGPKGLVLSFKISLSALANILIA